MRYLPSWAMDINHSHAAGYPKGEEKKMYYVIQVPSRKEENTLLLIKTYIGEDIIDDIFIPKRKKLIKIGGKWQEKESVLFTGYIFVKTSKPSLLQRKLYSLAGFEKVVGFGKRDDGSYTYLPLSLGEEMMIDELMGKENDHTIGISEISLKEGNDARIISGPLMGFSGKITRIDKHKRVAYIELDLAGRPCDVQVGIDIVREDYKPDTK